MNKYNPPPEVVAAQDHMTHVVNSVMQPQRIFDRYSERRLGWNSGWSAQDNLLIALAISLVTHSFLTSLRKGSGLHLTGCIVSDIAYHHQMFKHGTPLLAFSQVWQ